MGGTSSKTDVSALSETLTNVIMNTMQSCVVSSDQMQDLTVNNTGWKLWGSYNLTQQSEIRSDCFSDVNRQAQLQNNIISTISQASSANNVALLGAFGSTSSEATTNLTNIIRNNITMSNIQTSYNAAKQKQSITFNNSGVIGFESADLVQGSKLFAAATLQQLDRAGVFNSISNYVDQKSSATTENPLDFISKAIGSVANGISSSLMWIVFIVVGALFGFGFVLYMMSPEDRDAILPEGMPGRDTLVGMGSDSGGDSGAPNDYGSDSGAITAPNDNNTITP